MRVCVYCEIVWIQRVTLVGYFLPAECWFLCVRQGMRQGAEMVKVATTVIVAPGTAPAVAYNEPLDQGELEQRCAKPMLHCYPPAAATPKVRLML